MSGNVPKNDITNASYSASNGGSYPYITNYFPVKVFTTNPVISDQSNSIVLISNTTSLLRIRVEDAIPTVNQLIMFDTSYDAITANAEYYIGSVAAVTTNTYDIGLSLTPLKATMTFGGASTSLDISGQILNGGSVSVISYTTTTVQINVESPASINTRTLPNGTVVLKRTVPTVGQKFKFSVNFGNIVAGTYYYIVSSTFVSGSSYNLVLSTSYTLSPSFTIASASGTPPAGTLVYYNSVTTITVTGCTSTQVTFTSSVKTPFIGQLIQINNTLSGQVAGGGGYFITSLTPSAASPGLFSASISLTSSSSGNVSFSTPLSGLTVGGVLYDTELDYTKSREYLRKGYPNASISSDSTTEHRLVFKTAGNTDPVTVTGTGNIVWQYMHPWDGSWKKMSFSFNTPAYPNRIVDNAGYIQFGPLPSLRYTNPVPSLDGNHIGIDMYRYVQFRIVSLSLTSVTITTLTPHMLSVGNRVKIYGVYGGSGSGQNDLANSLASSPERTIATIPAPDQFTFAVSSLGGPNTVTYPLAENRVIGIRRSFDIQNLSLNPITSILTFTTKSAHNLIVGKYVEILGIDDNGNRGYNVDSYTIKVLTIPSSTTFTVTNYTSDTRTLNNATVNITQESVTIKQIVNSTGTSTINIRQSN
jgi:hypothetical protein